MISYNIAWPSSWGTCCAQPREPREWDKIWEGTLWYRVTLSQDEYCMTCDFAVSTGTFQRAAQNSQCLGWSVWRCTAWCTCCRYDKAMCACVCMSWYVIVCHSMSSYVMIWRCVQQGCYVWSILRMISAEKADPYRFLEWSTKNTPDISEACICCDHIQYRFGWRLQTAVKPDHIQYLTPFGQGSWSFWLTLQLTVCRNSTLVWLRACSYFLKTCMVAHRYKSELNWPHILALQSKSIQVQCSHPSARL